MEDIYGITYLPISNHRFSNHSLKASFVSSQGRNVYVQCVSWFYDKVNAVLESTLYFIAILPSH